MKERLVDVRSEFKPDVIIANGENSAPSNGMTSKSAEYLFNAGVDIITGGNHTLKWRDVYSYIESSGKIVRPANYPESTPGKGFLKFMFGGIKFCVINVMGIVSLEPLACPFETIDKILKQTNDCVIKIVDFHAETTSEKRAFGFYCAGRVSVVFGTHTHVQTSDEQILLDGTAYITDVGMCGASDSVLGVKTEISIKRMKSHIPLKFEHETSGIFKIECVLVEIDNSSGKAQNIKRFRIE